MVNAWIVKISSRDTPQDHKSVESTRLEEIAVFWDYNSSLRGMTLLLYD